LRADKGMRRSAVKAFFPSYAHGFPNADGGGIFGNDLYIRNPAGHGLFLTPPRRRHIPGFRLDAG
jgi:hypothetical protein